MTVSRHCTRWLAERQLEDLRRTQKTAMGEGREAERALTTLKAYGIGYGSPLRVVRRGALRYAVISELPRLG
jgi:hypothetical protein